MDVPHTLHFPLPITTNMNKTKTTYGVYNLIEWHALLRMGKATVRVNFTGGSITTQGVTPATFTTEDPIVQFAIEKSPEFKSGKIKVVNRVKLGGDVKIERNPPKLRFTGEDAKKTTEVKTEGGEECTESEVNDRKLLGDECCVKDASEEDCAGTPEDLPELVPADTGVIEKEFDNNDDARDYLEQNFGFIRSKLRNRADIVAAGKVHGIIISFS